MFDTNLSGKGDLPTEQLRQWDKFTLSGKISDYLEYRRLCSDETCISDAVFYGIGKEEASHNADENGWHSAKGTEI